LLELVNPSEMYGNCMTERSYTECSASCVGALVRWLGRRGGHPSPLASRAEAAVDHGVKLLRKKQREDGAYLGFWGVNFTYGIFHVVEALTAARVERRDPAIRRAIDWLVEHQRADGGWGEHWKSMLTEKYEDQDSQPAMTAWAVLALAAGGQDDAKVKAALDRGRDYLLKTEEASGAWPHKQQSGVFFSTAMLDYRHYKDVFPTWALAESAG
jgi:squalene cyclase